MTEQISEAVNNETQFVIQRLYIKDSSYEAPGTPQIFQNDWEPELTLDLNNSHSQLDKDNFEVVLTLTATVKNKKAIAFLCEVKQAGVFTLQNAPKEQLGPLLGSFCPNILYPYAREAISALVMRGAFPQLVLAPINFDALYMQKLEQEKEKATIQ